MAVNSTRLLVTGEDLLTQIHLTTFPFPPRQPSLVGFNVGLWLWICEVMVSEVLNSD